ncbi:MAG: hypothetical protein ACTSUV_03005 [Candidatus Ranarchaeia archaeon]
MATEESLKIIFDETHKERARISLNLKKVKNLLEMNGFSVERLVKSPISYNKLKSSDLLIIPCPASSVFSKEEINQILFFVKNGGGLILMSSSGGDKSLQTNLNEIAAYFGMQFKNNIVKDEDKHLMYDTVPLVSNLIESALTNEIKELAFPDSCSIEMGKNPNTIISTNPTSFPKNETLVGISKYGKGLILVLGTYKLFLDRVLGGIESSQNVLFALHIFNWFKNNKQPSIVQPFPPIKEEKKPVTKKPDKVEEKKTEKIPESPNIDRKEIDNKIAELEEKLKTQEVNITRFMTEFETVHKSLSEKVTSLETRIQEIQKQIKEIEEKPLPSSDMVAKPIEDISSVTTKAGSSKLKSKKELTKERKNTLELLEYLEESYKSGSLPRHEYEDQSEKLIKEINLIDKAIEKTS